MKQYKLKNKTTGEETICTKVEVDGFDYYVGDDKAKIGDKLISKVGNIFEYDKNTTELGIALLGGKKVIATNNPSIDIGQVIDRLGIIAHNSSPYIVVSKISNSHLAFQEGFEVGYNAHAETHTLSDDEVAEFLEWKDRLHLENEIGLMDRGFSMYMPKNGEIKTVTTKELLNIFKEQLPKTIWYE